MNNNEPQEIIPSGPQERPLKRIICAFRGHDEIWWQEDIYGGMFDERLFISNTCFCDRCGKWLRLEIN